MGNVSSVPLLIRNTNIMKYIPITILIIVIVASSHLFPKSDYLQGLRHGAALAGLAIGVWWLFSPSGSKV